MVFWTFDTDGTSGYIFSNWATVCISLDIPTQETKINASFFQFFVQLPTAQIAPSNMGNEKNYSSIEEVILRGFQLFKFVSV